MPFLTLSYIKTVYMCIEQTLTHIYYTTVHLTSHTMSGTIVCKLSVHQRSKILTPYSKPKNPLNDELSTTQSLHNHISTLLFDNNITHASDWPVTNNYVNAAGSQPAR